MSRTDPAPSGITCCFLVSMLGAMGFAAVYVLGFGAQLQGLSLAVSFGALALGLGWWSKSLEAHNPLYVEERIPMPGPQTDRRAVVDALASQPMPRAKLLGGMLAMTAGTIGAAVLFPVRSLYWKDPTPDQSLSTTGWTRGRALVNDKGQRIKPDDLAYGGMMTVFPELYDTDKYVDATTLLLKVDPRLLKLPAQRRRWVVGGVVAYSKLCTHAGCPVGLYSDDVGMLLCPCHHSMFDVYQGAQPVSGPAVRPLAQLPIALDRDGYLVAAGDFVEPPGAGWWDYP